MTALRVLLIEDSVVDAELVVALLEEADPRVRVLHARTLGAGMAELESETLEVVLADLSLPDASGLEAVRALRSAHPVVPIVVLTGHDDDQMAVDAVAAGAQDYVAKVGLTARLLLRALRYARERAAADAALRTSARWSAALLEGLEAPTCAVDRDGFVVLVNAAMHARTVLPVVGQPGQRLVATDRDHRQRDLLTTGIGDVLAGQLPRFEQECEATDSRWWSVRVSPLPDRAGAVVAQVDVSALKRAQQQLSAAALHDPLTGLPNRTLLRDRLERASAYSERQGQHVAVVFLDIDRFKLVNDTLGHATGDLVLEAVGQRLLGASRATDTVARVSGDEYVVALTVQDAAQAEQLAQRLLAAVNAPLRLEGRDIPVSASAGLALGEPGQAVDDVLGAADEAMYAAKAKGHGLLQVASVELRAQLLRRVDTEKRLEEAVLEGTFEVHYQPVVRLRDGIATGVEALVRLRGADGALVPPAAFIDVAERSGLVVPLGRGVLDRACREAAGWSGEAAQLTVAVNLSTRQLAQPDILSTVRASLSGSGLAPERLVLEVTESAVVEDAEAAMRSLTALKELGVRIAIDDFGTGYSSFLYLKRFPVDILKIDRSFVGGMLDSADDAAIVASIGGLARDVGLGLIAEGVETDEQRQHLLRLGCTEAQGYLFSRPVPPLELLAALAPSSAPVVPEPRPAPGGRPTLTLAVRGRLAQLSADGASPHTIAAVLNAEGVLSPNGRRWHPRSVARCLGHELTSAP